MANIDKISEIEELFNLFKDGVISKEEFDLLKAKAIRNKIEYNSQKEVPEKENLFSHEQQKIKNEIAPNKFKPTLKNKYIIFLLLLITISLIIVAILKNNLNDNRKVNSINNKKELIEKVDELIIEGENIWVRDAPSNGDVIMKLNSGDKCEVLGKGYFEEIRGMYDFWYKISYNGKVGWVYGSQSNIKTNYTRSDALELGLIESNRTGLDEELHKFFIQYSTNSISNEYINSEIGLYVLNNPGAMCYGNNDNSIVYKDFSVKTSNIYSHIPNGDKCSGYFNAEDGYYYEYTIKSDLPLYTDDGETSKRIRLPNQFLDSDIIKVCIIKTEEWLTDFYFIKINGEFFLICQDFCDCSA